MVAPHGLRRAASAEQRVDGVSDQARIIRQFAEHGRLTQFAITRRALIQGPGERDQFVGTGEVERVDEGIGNEVPRCFARAELDRIVLRQ
jgi:hypothetical protein